MKLCDILNEDPQAIELAANRSFNTLVSYANQLSKHKGKLGRLAMIVLEELRRSDKAAAEIFQQTIAPHYKQHIDKKVPMYFKTRTQARVFAKNGGKIKDMGADKPIGKRWATLVSPQDRRVKK
jgi:N-acetylglucosamine kinase-like BadF-type ATPase